MTLRTDSLYAALWQGIHLFDFIKPWAPLWGGLLAAALVGVLIARFWK